METVPCNLCGSAAAVPWAADLPDLLLERPAVRTTLVRCADCGLVYQNPRPTLAEMGEHYPAEYESYNFDKDAGRRSWLLERAVRYGLDKRARAVLRARPSGVLLDVGCSTGLFLNNMRRFVGWTLHGVEISPHAVELARRLPGVTVFTGTLEEAVYPAGMFDAVTLWDVFEHLHDPAATLREIRRVLRPDGVLVVRVPNLSSWDARLFGRAWAGLDAPRHLYLFDRETLPRILEANGFRIGRLDCAMGSYPTFLLSVRFWLTARGVPPSRRAAVGRLLGHPVMRLLSVPAFYLYGLRRRGPLLTAVAHPA